jgi:hypothetical protein
MVDGKTLRESMREEMNTLKKMNFHEKRQHIWEYHKAKIIAAVIIAVVIVSIVNRVLNPPKEDFLYIAWLGPQINPALLERLGERLEPIVYDPERQQVTVVTYAATQDHVLNAAMQTRFATRVSAGEVDIIFTTRTGINELYGMGGWMRPINESMIAPYIQLGLHMIEGQPMGISLAGSRLLDEVGIDTGDLYLAVVSTARRYEHITLALQELLR